MFLHARSRRCQAPFLAELAVAGGPARPEPYMTGSSSSQSTGVQSGLGKNRSRS